MSAASASLEGWHGGLRTEPTLVPQKRSHGQSPLQNRSGNCRDPRRLFHSYGHELLAFDADFDGHWRTNGRPLHHLAAYQPAVRRASVAEKVVHGVAARIDDHRMCGGEIIVVPQLLHVRDVIEGTCAEWLPQ